MPPVNEKEHRDLEQQICQPPKNYRIGRNEIVGGTSINYMTDGVMLNRGLELLASASVTHHTLFREDARWPGHCDRGDHRKPGDTNWHCFTLSRHDRHAGKWAMEKAPVARQVHGTSIAMAA